MHEPIATVFSSQSTKPEMIHNDELGDDEIMVTFSDIQFDPEEENILDDLIMSGK